MQCESLVLCVGCRYRFGREESAPTPPCHAATRTALCTPPSPHCSTTPPWTRCSWHSCRGLACRSSSRKRHRLHRLRSQAPACRTAWQLAGAWARRRLAPFMQSSSRRAPMAGMGRRCRRRHHSRQGMVAGRDTAPRLQALGSEVRRVGQAPGKAGRPWAGLPQAWFHSSRPGWRRSKWPRISLPSTRRSSSSRAGSSRAGTRPAQGMAAAEHALPARLPACNPALYLRTFHQGALVS